MKPNLENWKRWGKFEKEISLSFLVQVPSGKNETNAPKLRILS